MCSDDVAQATHWFDFQKMWPETAREMAIHFSSDPSILEGLTVTEAPGSSCRTLSGELLDSQPQIRNDLGLKSAIQDKVLRGLPN